MDRREQLVDICRSNPEAAADLILTLEGQVEQVAKLTKLVIRLESQVKELEDQLAANSRNSGKPPSTDRGLPPKPKSLRKPSGRRPGGQHGHEGTTLQLVEHPDHSVVHTVDSCAHCYHSLEDVVAQEHERHQVFDLPERIHVEVTEHCAELKQCPCCGEWTQAAFPEGSNLPAQYGPNIKATAVYLNQYQMLTYDRMRELFADLFDHAVCVGSLYNFNHECFKALENTEEWIKQSLIDSPVLHTDETGMKINGKTFWLHVASTSEFTYLQIHEKRGQAAIDDMNILPHFNGTAVHDHWGPYFKYNCAHALCNAHHLRQLIFVLEQYEQPWAQEMIDLLLEAKGKVEDSPTEAASLPRWWLSRIENSYDRILKTGYAANPIPDPPPQPPKRGRKKQSKPRNLLDRLKDHKNDVLAFTNDFRIPFDNNQGERDLRMAKVKQKVSGGFRSESGANFFARIRGYISTVKKQSENVLQALKAAFGTEEPHWNV